MTPALIMLVVPGLPSYNGVEVYYLKGVIGLPIVISFRDRWYTHIFFFFFLEIGSLMTSSSSAGPIQISKFPEPWSTTYVFVEQLEKYQYFTVKKKKCLIWSHVSCFCLKNFPWIPIAHDRRTIEFNSFSEFFTKNMIWVLIRSTSLRCF